MDFYVLEGSDERARLRFACRIAEKAYLQSNRVYVHASSGAEAARVDELLWTFRDTSFVPHTLAGTRTTAADPSPVLVGHDAAVAGDDALLINLSDEVPALFDRFARIAELVDEDPGRRLRGRERFRQYRERGCTLETHRLSVAHG